MGVSSSESHDLTAFYEMLTASFGVLSQNTGFYPSLDRIVETTLRPLNLGPGGRSYNEPISCLHHLGCSTPFWSFCRFLLALCPPMAEEPLKTLLLGAHATRTACLPHSNLSCRLLLAKLSIHGWGASKNPFSVAYQVTPKTFLGLFSASVVSPLAGTLDY